MYMTQPYAPATLVQESLSSNLPSQRNQRGSESEISGSLVQDFWTGIEYDGVPEFLGRLRNRGHRLIARWGKKILLETCGNQKTWRSVSIWEQWQWQRALESCQKWKPPTSLTGNAIY